MGFRKVNPRRVSFLALGDSYTIGEGVTEDQSWPNILADRITERGYRVDLTVIARTGWVTRELMASLSNYHCMEPFELVTVLIGVNDQYRRIPVEEYKEAFTRLLDQVLSYAGGRAEHVLVLSIPDWGVTPFAANDDREHIANEIDRFNQVNAAVAAAQRVRYMDVTEHSRTAAGAPGLVAGDGLHPSAEMYSLWADMMLGVVLEILGDSEKDQ